MQTGHESEDGKKPKPLETMLAKALLEKIWEELPGHVRHVLIIDFIPITIKIISHNVSIRKNSQKETTNQWYPNTQYALDKIIQHLRPVGNGQVRRCTSQEEKERHYPHIPEEHDNVEVLVRPRIGQFYV